MPARRPERVPKARFFRAPLRWIYEFVVEEVDERPPASRAGARRPRTPNARGASVALYAGLAVILAVGIVVWATGRLAGPRGQAAKLPRAIPASSPAKIATSHPSQSATSHPSQSATSQSSQSATSQSSQPASSPSTTTAGAAGASAACATMQMTPVPAAPGASQPSVPGLCESLGNGENWLVGCAPGFQTTCGPALQAEIACLRQAHHALTTADVQACAAQVARQLGAGG